MAGQDPTKSEARSPWKILRIDASSTMAEIRAAYLARVKESPPDRAPAEFELVRDAYEALRSPRRRAMAILTRVDPDPSLVALLDSSPVPRAFIGPRAWLEVLDDD